MSNKNFYNDRYKNNEFYWGEKPHFLITKLKNILPPDSSILDLGSDTRKNGVNGKLMMK